MTKVTAVDAYVDRHMLLAQKLERLAAAIEAHQDAVSPEQVHWGHVGDLDYVNELLDQALGFLRGEDR